MRSFLRQRPSPVTLALVLVAVGLMLAQLAGATHPRPKGATPLRVALVPAYEKCTSPNRTHGPPLGFPSCNPPAQTSRYLTVGSPDANRAGARSIGFVELKVSMVSGRVAFTASITDVRCLPGTSGAVCTGANAADGPDYSGELQMNAMIRISDHYNGPGLNEPATVVDIPFPANLTCANTADTSIGGACTVPPNAVQPALYPDGAGATRSVVEITQIQVFDGGADGRTSTQDNTVFEVQGVFIP
jgi:hypothetical protein